MTRTTTRTLRIHGQSHWAVAALAAAVLALASLVGVPDVAAVGSATAHADTAPVPPTPATVSSDPLPTVQINGIVWAQVTVGDTVYAVGQFTSARPAGAPVGTDETPRANILAYDIRSGLLIQSFDHQLSGAAQAITASPDGSRIYVGGVFNTVDGQSHQHLAAFDTATGALVSSFAPVLNSRVMGLSATATTVYAGGAFTVVNGQARLRLAAFTTAGALTSWAPVADSYQVDAVVASPDLSRVIIGGSFTTLNGVTARGLGAVSATTGATLAFAANIPIHDTTWSAGILTLSTDGHLIYGGGFVALSSVGNFEGTFAADPNTGAIVWLNDCFGDTYSVYPIGSVLYVSSHVHECSGAKLFPTQPDNSHWHGTAWSTAPISTFNANPDRRGNNFSAFHTAELLDWFPQFTVGSFAGQNQATWSVTGNSSYLAMGGEFPSLNGIAQQGLVRFAVAPLAPNKDGPAHLGLPSLTVSGSGAAQTVTVSVTAAWDRDNERLTYALLRDGSTGTPRATAVVASRFYSTPTVALTDPAPLPGTHSYRVRVTDSFGNSILGPTVSTAVSPFVAPATTVTSTGFGKQYVATFGVTTLAAGVITVPFTATGAAAMPSPNATCLRVTSAAGTTLIKPSSVTFTQAIVRNWVGTLTYPATLSGTYTLQYACNAGFTQATIGVLTLA